MTEEKTHSLLNCQHTCISISSSLLPCLPLSLCFSHLLPLCFWEHSNIMFDTSLSCFKKEQTSETVLRKEYQQLRERYNSYFEAYTDGSKSKHKVAAAAFFTKDPDNPKTTRLRDGSSVFNAELEGILLSLKKFLTLPQFKNFIFYTESLSAVKSLRCKTFKTKNVQRFYNLLNTFCTRSRETRLDEPYILCPKP